MPDLRGYVQPLHTLDPTAQDDSDLEVFREIVGDARVVCLGESAHYVSEFVRLRDRLTRYLVRELGFTTLVLESGFPEGLLVDDWVRGGSGRLSRVAAAGITYAFGQCVETRTQLQWMRDRNARTTDQVGFAGMDVPGWCRTPTPGMVACLDRIPAKPDDPELLALADSTTAGRNPGHEVGGEASESVDVPLELEQGVIDLVERAAQAGDEIAWRCAYGAQRVVEFLAHGLYPGPGRNLRNEVMADNLQWLSGRGHRILVSAHNVHLQRFPSFDGTAPVGSLLAPVLGDDLVVIGTTRGAGVVPGLDLDARPEARFRATAEFVPPDHSLDALLASVGWPQHVVNLRSIPSAVLDGVTAMSGQDQVIGVDPARAFDAIVHVATPSSATGV